jgi:endonuclease YncB( thermonuclease family)
MTTGPVMMPFEPYQYRATAARVVDGDTYHLDVDLGFRVGITIPVRLCGVDTPELNTEAGKAARWYVIGLLKPGGDAAGRTPMLIQSYKDRQSFARGVCDVWSPWGEGWRPLADLIIEAGHGSRLEV